MSELGYYLTVFALFLLSIFYHSKIYYDYLEVPNQKKQFILFLIPGLTFIGVISVWTSYISSRPPLVHLLYPLLLIWFLFVGVPNLWFLNKIKRKKLYEDSICGHNVSIVDFNIANAFSNLRTNEIYVTKPTISLLTPEEICSVIEHENGHLASRYIGWIVGVVQTTLSLSTFLFLFLLMILALYKPVAQLIHIYFGMYVIFYLTTLSASMWFWLCEHEADLNSSQKGALASALTKMELFNNLTRYYKLTPEEFNKLKISQLKLREVRLRDVIKEILSLPKVTLKLPLMHPPTLFRLCLLSNASNAGVKKLL